MEENNMILFLNELSELLTKYDARLCLKNAIGNDSLYYILAETVTGNYHQFHEFAEYVNQESIKEAIDFLKLIDEQCGEL